MCSNLLSHHSHIFSTFCMSMSTLSIFRSEKWYEMEMCMIWYAETFYDKTNTWTLCSSLYCWSKDIFCCEHKMAIELIRNFKNTAYFYFWNQESMSEVMWLDIEKCIERIIFVDFMRRDFASNNS